MPTSALPAASTAFALHAPKLPPNSTTTTDLDASAPRRIALQSPQDLLHLRAIALRNAREKIDLHLPPNASANNPTTNTDDDLRKQVEAYVQAFIDQTFVGVRDNVEINAIPGAEAVEFQGPNGGVTEQEEFEEFDGKLARRITELHGRIEKLNAEVAETRRETVGRAAGEWREGYKNWDEELTQREEQALRDQAEQEPVEENTWVEGFEDMEAARSTWDRALESLMKLNGEEELSAAGKRAGDAVDVVRAMEERG
ncbi:MAG: hypothetical protein Q9162_006779 [Coniocarpon cinnabarinum]